MSEGPELKSSKEIYRTKYLSTGESFREGMSRIANTLSETTEQFHEMREMLLNQRFLPAGRIQASIGAPRQTTPYNCFVSGTIEDSMEGIMDRAKEAALTMKLGGGIGYDFSTLRPSGSNIRTLDSASSGPISFMEIYDRVCNTVSSAGHRRGAQMAVLRVDHPDIEEYIHSKNNHDKLTNFNTSIGVTDKFMEALEVNGDFDLVFDGVVRKTIKARYLWDAIMRSTWDWAEPGVLFIDRINKENNLWYCETIAATNPCGEQPLPPYGACLLGSFNLTKYVYEEWELDPDTGREKGWFKFNWGKFKEDIPLAVRMLDNVIDEAMYPLSEQEREAKAKRRMGIGVTGLANAGEVLGYDYGSVDFLGFTDKIMMTLRNIAYSASVELAKEKGPFPLFDADLYLQSGFMKRMTPRIRKAIKEHGIRNSHLLSIAPTGTISMGADNVSSGIEPVFALEYEATINFPSGVENVKMVDYGYREWGIKGVTANELDPTSHVDVLNTASYHVDSACSKTCNVADHVTFEDFKDLYLRAYHGGAKGCTTFRSAGKRYGVRNISSEENYSEGTACYIDPETGVKECA